MVFNPQAGHKKAAKLKPDIISCFAQNNIEVDILESDYKWHGIELLQKCDLSGYDGIVAAGGDGTNFETINGYYKNSSAAKPPIGLIPVGTGNAFARELNLKNLDWKSAIDIIKKGNTKKVDVARLITQGKDYYFMNILGLGFVADVGGSAHKMKITGEMSYILGVFYQLGVLKSFHMELELDGKLYQRDAIFAEIANTQYTGAIFHMAPKAVVDDGFLDVIILNKINRRRLLKLFPTIFKGTHIAEKEVEYFQAKKIKITTDFPKLLIPDGELFGSTPIEIECLEKSIEVFWP